MWVSALWFLFSWYARFAFVLVYVYYCIYYPCCTENCIDCGRYGIEAIFSLVVVCCDGFFFWTLVLLNAYCSLFFVSTRVNWLFVPWSLFDWEQNIRTHLNDVNGYDEQLIRFVSHGVHRTCITKAHFDFDFRINNCDTEIFSILSTQNVYRKNVSHLDDFHS